MSRLTPHVTLTQQPERTVLVVQPVTYRNRHRQNAWQRRQVAAGKCHDCGRVRTTSAYYCDRCATRRKKSRARWRKRRAARPKSV